MTAHQTFLESSKYTYQTTDYGIRWPKELFFLINTSDITKNISAAEVRPLYPKQLSLP